jgi:transposase
MLALILPNSTILPQPYPDGEILIQPFKFTNDGDGFQLLVSKLESFDKSSIIIGLESTAHYGDNLVSISCCLLLPCMCHQPYSNVYYAKE